MKKYLVVLLMISLFVPGVIFAQTQSTQALLESLIAQLQAIIVELIKHQTSSPLTSLTITSPNGGETWVAGDEGKEFVSWNYVNLDPKTQATIYLQFTDNGLCNLGSVTVGDKLFSTRLFLNQNCPEISRTVVPGSYRLLIRTADQTVKDYSDGSITVVNDSSLGTNDNVWQWYNYAGVGMSLNLPRDLNQSLKGVGIDAGYGPAFGPVLSSSDSSSDYDHCVSSPAELADPNGQHKSQMVLGGKTFCLITVSEGATGHTYLTDTYITKIGTTYITTKFQTAYLNSTTNLETFGRARGLLNQIMASLRPIV